MRSALADHHDDQDQKQQPNDDRRRRYGDRPLPAGQRRVDRTGLRGHLGQLGSVQRGHRVDCSTEIDTETLGHPLDLGSCQDSMNDGTQSLFVVCAGVQQLLEVGRVDDMLLRSEVRTGQRRAQEQGI